MTVNIIEINGITVYGNQYFGLLSVILITFFSRLLKILHTHNHQTSSIHLLINNFKFIASTVNGFIVKYRNCLIERKS